MIFRYLKNNYSYLKLCVIILLYCEFHLEYVYRKTCM